MKKYIVILSLLLVACSGTNKPPSQVVYRYDDHRYLELIGYYCEGALWYHDTQKNIHTELVDGVYSTYQIFTHTYIHPSEKYILIPRWEPGAYKISKDYGKKWGVATYMSASGTVELDSEGINRDRPEGKEIKRIVVVNDQAFITTSKGHLYMSSYPFEDPRLKPGGPGIDFTWFDDTYYLYSANKNNLKGEYVKSHIRPESPGSAWGTVVFMKQSLGNLVDGNKANFQNLPDKEPEVKNYKGWDHMQCNMRAGL
ncbi:hypothetical protein MUU48_03290 [Scandinavium sp. H11S7]|uniref:T6SS immunity protein Tli3 family protein n=1 Tax=Scandinavium hiltneri TaxID=2926519 RepID=UPI0021658ED2|nr:hypothetical protein [Scandinavium hiltneri]MCS2155966.1 hypothetical protein [Scandinavium hiltneri]